MKLVILASLVALALAGSAQHLQQQMANRGDGKSIASSGESSAAQETRTNPQQQQTSQSSLSGNAQTGSSAQIETKPEGPSSDQAKPQIGKESKQETSPASPKETPSQHSSDKTTKTPKEMNTESKASVSPQRAAPGLSGSTATPQQQSQDVGRSGQSQPNSPQNGGQSTGQPKPEQSEPSQGQSSDLGKGSEQDKGRQDRSEQGQLGDQTSSEQGQGQEVEQREQPDRDGVVQFPQSEQGAQNMTASASSRPFPTGVGRVVIRNEEGVDAVLSNDGTPDEFGCRQGERVCESTRTNEQSITRETSRQCYNQTSHVCAQRGRSTKAGRLLCPKSAPLLCGSQCYSRSMYVCSVKEVLCPSHFPDLCGWSCFSNETHRCVDDQLVPLLDVRQHPVEMPSMFEGLATDADVKGCKDVCNTTSPVDSNRHFPRCFDSSTHVCVDREKLVANEDAFLCPRDHPMACGDKCFTEAEYSCHVRSVLCPMVAQKVCGLDCYDPAIFHCKQGVLIAYASMTPEMMYGREQPSAIQQGEQS